MDYLMRPGVIPDNGSVMGRQRSLAAFFGKLKEVAIHHCRFDLAGTLPVIVECADESQSLKALYFLATFGASPFVGGLVGAELDVGAIAPAAHHAENLVYVMGSHTGYDHETKTMGTIYREKEGGFSPCCGKLAGVLGPYLKEYEFAKNGMKVFKEEGRVLLAIPSRLLGTNGSCSAHLVRLCLDGSLVKGGWESKGAVTAESPYSVLFEAHPDLQRALEAKKRTITSDAAPIGDDLSGASLKFVWSSSEPAFDGMTRRLHPFMHEIVSSTDYAPMVTVANVNTWIEFNRFVDAVHAIPDVFSKGVFGVSGLTIDLYIEGRSYPYSNVYYPQYAFFKPAGQAEGTIMGPSEINHLLDGYTPAKERPSLDQILACNDQKDEEIAF
ncbi:MAG: hypothetical protein SWE60_07140 [Thermodesulfobacteriota bacterium]|nr:hypothetical protein [Thermodesulfobacteriota bacterium]